MPTARTSFSTGRRIVRRGQTVAADDPVLKGREHLFRPSVEQATAAPGEQRDLVRCDVAGCTYSGTARGLKIHTGQAHKDDG